MIDISERSSILGVGGGKSECVEGSGRKEEGSTTDGTEGEHLRKLD